MERNQNKEPDLAVHDPAPPSFRATLTGTIAVWFLVAVSLASVFIFPERLGLSGITISPVYHGAIFLGLSIIAAVVVAFSLFGHAMASRAFFRVRSEHMRLDKSLRRGKEDWLAFEKDAYNFELDASDKVTR